MEQPFGLFRMVLEHGLRFVGQGQPPDAVLSAQGNNPVQQLLEPDDDARAAHVEAVFEILALTIHQEWGHDSKIGLDIVGVCLHNGK